MSASAQVQAQACKTVCSASSSSTAPSSDESVLLADDWRLVKAVGDGSCFFHSISATLQGEYKPEELRRAASELVMRKAEEEINGATVAQWIEWETGMTPSEYMQVMAQDGAWGGAIELHLLADFLSAQIKVYERSGNGRFMLQHVFGSSSSSSPSSCRCLHVVYDGSHYDALIPARMQEAGSRGAEPNTPPPADRLVLGDPAKLKSQIAVRNKFGQCVLGYPEPKGEQHTATVIFMHGLGDSGYGWAPVSEQLQMPWIKFMFPTAPAQPVSLNMGMEMPAWFDIYSLDPEDKKEDVEGMLESAKYVSDLIEKEIQKGIPPNRIVLGGFSQGGAIAYATSLMLSETPLAGVLCLSTWIPRFVRPSPAGLKQDFLVCHGDSDMVVQYDWGRQSFEKLVSEGAKAEFKTYRGMGHSLCGEELQDMRDFLLKRLPGTAKQ